MYRSDIKNFLPRKLTLVKHALSKSGSPNIVCFQCNSLRPLPNERKIGQPSADFMSIDKPREKRPIRKENFRWEVNTRLDKYYVKMGEIELIPL